MVRKSVFYLLLPVINRTAISEDVLYFNWQYAGVLDRHGQTNKKTFMGSVKKLFKKLLIELILSLQ